ncbi:MAG: hypothetical protein JXB23_16985 [Candidatus Aminicenantes bacterium]|nr:hypothetical protein [Candidatus Aminicenantes bacterium]
MFKSKSLVFLFSLEVLAIAVYIRHQFLSSFPKWLNDSIFLFVSLLAILIILIAFILHKLVHYLTIHLSEKTKQPAAKILKQLLAALSPVLLLYLVFLPYVVILKDIRGFLLPLSLLGSLYLTGVLLSRLKRARPQTTILPKFAGALCPNRMPPKHLSLFVFLSAFIVFVLYATGIVFPPQPFTGDEPHYLLITKSILEDGDINLFNNYKNKDYLEYYPGDLRSHAFRGKKGDHYQYSKHLPAVSVLVLPAFYIGEKAAQLDPRLTNKPEIKRQIIVFFARLPLCLLTALSGLMLFLIARDMTQRQDIALLGWAVFCFTAPVLFYSHLIYPEIPAALIAMFLIRYMILKKETHSRCVFLAGMGIALLPWFGVKYIVLSAVLFIASLLAFRGSAIEKKRQKLLLFFAPIILSAGMFLRFLWNLYGSFAPSSVYRGAPLDSSTPVWLTHFLKSDFLEFFSRVVGYFLDQRFGIFIYTPVYLLSIAGLFYFRKQKKKEALYLVLVFSVFGIFSAYYYWGGYCPPGRPMIPVIWILALFTGFSLTASRNRFRSIVMSATVASSFFVVWMALKNPWLLYHDNTASGLYDEATASNLLLVLSNTFIDFEKMFPLISLEAIRWIPLIVWMIGAIVISLIFIKKAGKTKPESASLSIAGHLSVVICLSLLVLTYAFFDIRLDRKDAYQEQSCEIFFQDANHYGHELGGFWTKGKRETSVLLQSPHPLPHIEVSLTGRIKGTTEIRVGRFRKTIDRTKENDFRGAVAFSSSKGFPMHNNYLHSITIKDSSGFVPFKLDRKEQDNRYLGVFVAITIHPQNHPKRR